MEPVWLTLGITLAVIGIATVTVGVKMMVGVPGEVRDLKSRVRELGSAVETIDGRITSEVKARASAKATEARQDKRSIEEEAAQVLSTASGRTNASRRPSVLTGV